MQINLKKFLMSEKFVVYTVSDKTRCLYVGCCRLADMQRLPDARRAGVTLHDECLVNLLEIETDCSEAVRKVEQLYSVLNMPQFPFVNVLNPKRPDQRLKGVECVETGIVYESMSQASRELGIALSNLSTHLSTGRGTVAGHTFRRV